MVLNSFVKRTNVHRLRQQRTLALVGVGTTM